MERKIYPFTAIVGQEIMKKALILNAVCPAIGGVLIKGEKGTAKSTAVRSLADILPPLEDESDETMKVVELPVNATEDRVVGTIDLEHALRDGEKRFEPGLLAKAHRNILYVDEINLLDDHVVDVLLDAAAMGVNIVEREGISYSHPARFLLVGTMNPEEGDIRPQLLDRFGLSVDVKGERDMSQRVEVIKRRLLFEASPDTFIETYDTENQILRSKVMKARRLLGQVEISDCLLETVAYISITLGVDGHRPDITMLHTVKAMAAFDNRIEVTREDLREAVSLVMPHRMRKKPFEEKALNMDVVDKILEQRF